MDNLRISVITDNLIAIIHHHILKGSKLVLVPYIPNLSFCTL